MSLTPDEIEAERKRFEAWWYGLYGAKINPPTSYFQFLGNGYLSERIEWKWRTWLAAIESERERVRKEQDDAEALMRMQEPQRARMLEKWESGE